MGELALVTEAGVQGDLRQGQEAARLLGIARETLRYKLRDLRLFVTRSFDAAEDNPPRPVRLARRAAAT